VAALDDDLDLPTAVATVREILRCDLPADERRWLVLDADAVLGLDLHKVWGTPVDVPATVQARLDRRASARSARDYATSDVIRDELRELGWDVTDGPDGQTVTER
jgi:cysteinyl-tRNA synthetase